MSATTATSRIYSQRGISTLSMPIAQPKQSDRLILIRAVSATKKAYSPCLDSSCNSDPPVARVVCPTAFSPWQPAWQALTKAKLFG